MAKAWLPYMRCKFCRTDHTTQHTPTYLLVKHEGDQVAARDLALDDQLPAVEDDERRGNVRQHSRHD
jgi:hypothetical protein